MGIKCWLVAFLFLGLASLSAANPIDSIQFGNSRMEKSHRFEADSSDIIEGALGASARKLLLKGTDTWIGGSLTFHMAVDPTKPNYFTAKFWGSDLAGEANRLMLYIEGKQVGQRHLGEVDPLDIMDTEPRFQGRFFYKTIPLPFHLTEGKQSVELKIQVEGPIWGYGPTIERFQHNLSKPSRGIYWVYTHSDPFFVPSPSEKQGISTPDFPLRKEPGIEVIKKIKDHVNHEVNKAMSRKDRPLSHEGIKFLAHSCIVPWSDAYHNKEALEKIIFSIDHHYLEFEKDPTIVEKTWHGAGPSAVAVSLLGKPLRNYLDKKIDGSELTRRKAWAKLFMKSRDWHVQHRRAYTNQTMIVDYHIYVCNRAVRVLLPSRAWGEEKAIKLLHEAVGIIPWSGSWNLRGTPDWSKGKRYLQLTKQGLTRELGYVGGYGEIVVGFVQDMYDASRPSYKEEGDPLLKKQLVKIAKARAVFRYPSTDGEGYQAMRLESVIGWRDWHYPGSVTYGQALTNEGGPLSVAAATLDPDMIAYGQQTIKENQFFHLWDKINGRRGHAVLIALSKLPSIYEQMKDYPQKNTSLPMARESPDFVFSDPEVGAIAVKQGEDILYASLYWRARYAVNNLARVHYLTPAIERDATINISSRFNKSDKFHTIRDRTNAPFSKNFEGFYKDANMFLAMAGQRYPIARIPAHVKDFKPGKENIYAGKADFYMMSYGPYYVAMNCNRIKSYSFSVPEVFRKTKNLVTGKAISKTKLTVRPMKTVVLYRGQ